MWAAAGGFLVGLLVAKIDWSGWSYSDELQLYTTQYIYGEVLM